MTDQAAALRQLVALKGDPPDAGKSSCEIITVTSGKGGVGKSNITINTAIQLGRMGARVLVMDADIGTANLDILLGLGAKPHLGDVFEGTMSLYDVICPVTENLFLIPGASGISSLSELPYERRGSLREDLSRIAETFDYLFIDTSAGVSEAVLTMMRGADRLLLICTAEPTAVVDAYALCKAWHNSGQEGTLELIANNVKNADEASEIFEKIRLAVGHFLKKELKYLGHVVHDVGVAQGVVNQKPIMLTSTHGPACTNFEALAASLFHADPWREGKGIQQLYNQLVSD